MAHVLVAALAAAHRFDQDGSDDDDDDSGSKGKDVVFENMRFVRKCSFLAPHFGTLLGWGGGVRTEQKCMHEEWIVN